MSDIGLKIQIGNTNIELSGDAEIVRNIFNDIRENGLGKMNVIAQVQNMKSENVIIEKTENKIVKTEEKSKKIQKAKTQKTSLNITTTYQMVDLDINPEDRSKFKEEYAKYKTDTNVQQVLVLAYLLRKFAGLETINTNIIFTALRTVGKKASFNIPQSFRNTRKLMINTSPKHI